MLIDLLNTASNVITLQVGAGTTAGTDSIDVTLSSVLSSDLSIDSLDIGSTGDASAAITALDSAIDALAAHLAGCALHARAAEPFLGAASRLFPVLSRARARKPRPPPGRARTAVREGVRVAAFDALAALFRLVAAAETIVLVLDDAHWADADSALLLASLLQTEALGALLVVLAHRPAPRRQPLLAAVALLDLPRSSLVLGPLEPSLPGDDVAALACALGFEESEIAPLLQASAGRPLDLVELLRHRASLDRGGSDEASQRPPRTFEATCSNRRR